MEDTVCPDNGLTLPSYSSLIALNTKTFTFKQLLQMGP